MVKKGQKRASDCNLLV